jgi:hypothetical protein
MAIQPSSMMIALMAVGVICFAGWVMDFTGSVVVGANGETEVHVYTTDPGSLDLFIEAFKTEGTRAGVFSTMWQFVAGKLHRAVGSLFELDVAGINKNMAYCFRAAVWAVRYHFAYCIIFLVIELAVLALAGGAICRIAALQFARGEKPGLTEALRFSSTKFMDFFFAPLLPLIIICIVALVVWLIGFAGNIPKGGVLIIGFFMPLVLVLGVAIALIAIGTIGGLNLMFPAVAYDGCDCWDAFGRSFHYVYARPWRIAFYSAVAAVYGAVCYVVVRCFAFLVLMATFMALDAGIKGEYAEGSKLSRIWEMPALLDLIRPSVHAVGWTEKLASYMIYAWLLVIFGLVISFIMSFYFSANTIIYALIRSWTDNTDIEQIYSASSESETDIDITNGNEYSPEHDTD